MSTPPPARARLSRALLGLVLAPVLVMSLWIEVAAATVLTGRRGVPGHQHDVLVVVAVVFGLAGPAMLAFATARTRRAPIDWVERVVQIERRTLALALPLGILGVAILAASVVL